MIPLLIYLMAFIVRIIKIERGNFVIWDEAHFGKFSQKILNREFYFDVHPPFGKFLTALSGLIFDQNTNDKPNSFDFGSKDNFPATFDYTGMRMFHAAIASFTCLFAYLILRQFNSKRRSFLISLLFIFENGNISISRLVLLDSHLLAFTSLCVYLLVLYYKIWIKEYKDQVLPEPDEINMKIKNEKSIENDIEQNKEISGLKKDKKWNKKNIICKDITKISKGKIKKPEKYKVNETSPNIMKDGVLWNSTNIMKNDEDHDFEREKQINKTWKLPSLGQFLHSSDFILILLGLSLGFVMSIKWIGCLAVSHIGLFIAFDLSLKLINRKYSLMSVFVHFIKRAIYLICLPASVYLILFYLHFKIVNHSGSDDGFVSSEFQLSFKNNVFDGLLKYVSFGKQVTIKTENGYLHSHNHEYPVDYNNKFNKQSKSEAIKSQKPENPKQLQVTTYGHKDKNNNFYIQKVTDEPSADFVRDKDKVALFHSETQGHLFLTTEDSIVTKNNKIVAISNSPINEYAIWEVEVHSDSVNIEEKIKAISTLFYLKCLIENEYYYLYNTDEHLTFGFGQGEVIASKTGKTLFNIEENFYSDSPNPKYQELMPSFIKKFIEHHKLMFRTNKSFTQDPNLDPDRIVSKPYEWFVLTRGLRMSQWHADYKFYMFMNPLILYSTSLSILIAPFLLLIKTIRAKIRKAPGNKVSLLRSHKFKHFKLHSKLESMDKKYKEYHDYFLLYLNLGGFLFHYIPFFFVGRVLYLHHYFPALFYATLNLSYILKNISFRLNVVFVVSSLIIYYLYSPLTYGFADMEKVKYLRVIKSWDFTE